MTTADGFSFNFGSAELGELGSAEEGMTGKTANNLSFRGGYMAKQRR